MSQEAIQTRLAALKNELQNGVAKYQHLIAQANEVSATVQRIQGAIAVLEELSSDPS